jgi:hypothetical protein
LAGVNSASTYFGCWDTGKYFSICAYESANNLPVLFVMGDPWVMK